MSNSSQHGRTVTIPELVTILTCTMKAERPVMIWGPPGIGKSEAIEQIGLATGRPVIDMRLLLMEPTDLKGIPYYDHETKTMVWAPSAELPQAGTELENAILFLDEMPSAPPSVQASAYQLILNRRVGTYVLPPGVSIVAAGNRETDKGVVYRMPSPLANRFIHVSLKEDFKSWSQWAVNNDIHPDVVGFLTATERHLFNFDPKRQDKAFATPRSWVFVSQVLDDTMPENLTATLVAGCVGEGVAIEFMQHRKFVSKLPSPEDVLSGKVKKLAVKEISARYSLTINLCYTLKNASVDMQDKEKKMNSKTFHAMVDNFLQFMMDNFTHEMVILGARTALREYNLPVNQKEMKNFNKFYKEYSKFVF